MRRSRAAAAPVSVTQISLFERCPSLPSAPDDDSGIGPQGRQGHSEPLRFARSFRGSLAPLHSGHELRPLCCERALRTEQLQGVNVGRVTVGAAALACDPSRHARGDYQFSDPGGL